MHYFPILTVYQFMCKVFNYHTETILNYTVAAVMF